MIFTGYNPYTPSRSTPPTAGDLPDVPLYVSEAAQSVNATHSSADGKTAYDERKYSVWYCKWDNETKRFGSWYRIMDDSGLPADAVRIP